MKKDFFENKLIRRFEEMLDEDQNNYFDVEEFDEIIAYYIEIAEIDYASKALLLAKNQHPYSIEIKIKEIEILLIKRDFSKAFFLLKKLHSLETIYVDLFVVEGKYWSLSGFPLKAIDFYKKALKYDYEDPIYLYISIGDEFLNIKELAKALYYFKKALYEDPEDEYVFYCCIRCFKEAYLYRECITFLEEFINQDPYNERAWYQLGLEYLEFLEYKKAIEAFNYAILIDNTFLSAYIEKAKAYEKIEEYQKAIDIYQESFHLDETHASAYYKIGICHKKLGNHYQAIRYFRLAIKGDPQMDKPWFEASCIYEKLKDYQVALEHLIKALELDPENSLYWKKAIYLNISLGYYSEAFDAYARALELDPYDDVLWMDYIELLIEKNEYKRAIFILNKNANKFKKIPQLYYYTFYCYFSIKEKKKAFLELSKAIKLAPSFSYVMIKKYPSLFKKSLIKKIFI